MVDPESKNSDTRSRLTLPRPWLTLLIFGIWSTLVVLIGRLLPPQTPLWQAGVLALVGTVLSMYGPDVLARLLSAFSRARGSNGQDNLAP